MLSASDIEAAVVWFRECVPSSVRLIFLNLPEIYDAANPQLSAGI